MKNIIKKILNKISRIIFWTTPFEFREMSKENTNYVKLEAKIADNLAEETFKNFKEHLKKSMLFKDIWKIRDYAIKNSLQNNTNNEYYYLEFGVYKGSTTNFFSKFVKKMYVFDSFKGLKEDWMGTLKPKGCFNLNGKPPKLNSNVEPIVGWVEDTLDDFLKKHNPKIKFVHMDIDTYNSTKFVLEKIKPYIVKNAIIIFDELYNYIGWEDGEYKALSEVFKETEFQYKAFSIDGKQSVIEII